MKEKTLVSQRKGRGRATHQIKGFLVRDNECIWMKAGVINYRICDHAYDCYHCPFDTGMRKAMGIDDRKDSKEIAPRWVEFLKQSYHGCERPCRHSLTGRIETPKICPHNYECYHCAYDQMLDEIDLVREPEPPTCKRVAGYRMANGYYYHMGHNWLRFEHGGRVRVGLDEFASCLFGPADHIELPQLGDKLKQHEVGWAFGRQSHRAAALSPVSGTVLAINHNVRNHPDVIPLDPYHEGWLMMLEPTAPKRNLKGLYFGLESDRWMEMEVQALLHLTGSEYEQLAATGGEPVSDLFATLPGIDWDVLTQTFLRTGCTTGEK